MLYFYTRKCNYVDDKQLPFTCTQCILNPISVCMYRPELFPFVYRGITITCPHTSV